MKKLFATVVSAGLVLSMVACSAKSVNTNTETYNGITKTVTTTTQNGKTTEEIVYTDEDGNTLDEETGKAAFEAAKSSTEDSDDEVTDVVLHFENATEQSIKELYLGWQDGDFGDNELSEDLEVGDTLNIKSDFSYIPDVDAFKVKIVFEDDTNGTFEDQIIPDLVDPQDVTFTFTEDGNELTCTIS